VQSTGIFFLLMEGGGEKGKGEMGNSNGVGTVHKPVGVHTGYCS
jgi:hypothetical protein